MEFDLARSSIHLTPEAVERRQAEVFVTGDIHSLIEFDGSGKRLAHHNVAAADIQPEEQILSRDCICVLLRGRRRCASGSALNHFHRWLLRGDGLSAYLGSGGRKSERAFGRRHKDVGVRRLGGSGAFAVNYTDRCARSGLGTPHEFEFRRALPVERRGLAAFDHKHEVELLVESHDGGHLNANLRERRQRPCKDRNYSN